MSGWQPMAAAPRDGSRIVGWFGDRAIVVFWRSGPEYAKSPAGVQRATGRTIWYWSDGYSRYREADCWQPEPTPPDPAQFAIQPPAPKRGPTVVVRSPVARRRVIEKKGPQPRVREAQRPVVAEPPRQWCEQCERAVTAGEASGCASPFCKAKVLVA